MATSREVYHRIIWDVRLDSSAFVVGYQERLSSTGMREKPLAQWATDGDIPWHRIRYIRCGDMVVWDREQHLDLISSGELPAAAWKSETRENIGEKVVTVLDSTAIFTPRPIYKYHIQGWQLDTQKAASVNLETLEIASFNVLCDLYEKEKIATEKRLPAIIEQLRQCNADIIAIQEATPALAELLLSQTWVRNYYISESSTAETVRPLGNLLLSRLPFTLVEHQFSGHKRVLVGSCEINGQLLHIAVVHLTSDYAQNALEKRQHQLATIVAYLQKLPGNSLIAGDFNTRGNEQQEILMGAGYVDIWQQLHPDAAGYTFDPQRNSLAALMSLKGIPVRLDRILLRSPNHDWQAQSIDLFACEPIALTEGKIYPSDHFGLRAVLKFAKSFPASALSTVRPVYQSAVVVIPPDNVLPAIQAIRQRYDARVERWMAHINLLYGFLPESYFAEAVEIIAPALAQLQPFQITLTDFQTFTHRKSSTAWLRPVVQPENALHELQTVLQNLFPQCNEQSSKTKAGFTPHLSVGQFPSPEAALAELPQWYPVSFRVDSIALISRRGDEPFAVKHIVYLGGGENGEQGEKSLARLPPIRTSERQGEKSLARLPPIRTSEGQGGIESADRSELGELVKQLEPELTPEQQLQRDTVLEVVTQACAECLGFQPSLHLLGSARLGVQSPDSDLDAVCLIPTYLSGEAFLVSVQQRLQGLCHTQLVLDARVPVLRLQLEGISLDLLYARAENYQLARKTPQNLDPISLKAIIGCWEADLMEEVVGKYVSLDTFRQLLRAVRAWAKARDIYSNAWGFLGGFSWALLCAFFCTFYKESEASIEKLLANFFQLLHHHDWQQAIVLTDVGRQYQVQSPRDWLPVVTSIEPCHNSARNVTRSTAQIVQNEFARGATLTGRILAGQDKWTALFKPIELHQETETFLILKVGNQDARELEKCCGILEGYIISLIIQLEQLGIFVRPWTGIQKMQNTARLVLGLHLYADCQSTTVEQLARDFLLQLNFQNSSFEVVLSN
ncbi:RNA 2',3'-cyclic phosphodiesterase [Calothrix sp. NIES-2100]|uniref:poly(A) polymerase n=1 Tax=Calothrix sp. NIES-2100 TaxID=1954172 RepID=UPI000B5E55AC|nr:RNA 2',3'-cyclic phosphodiesterase [Calothrix sp. NIES-2100]